MIAKRVQLDELTQKTPTKNLLGFFYFLQGLFDLVGISLKNLKGF